MESAYGKPKVHSNRESPGWVNVLNALSNEAAMDRLVCCHLADRRILSINNNSKLYIVSCITQRTIGSLTR
jgi:hypothetical protein